MTSSKARSRLGLVERQRKHPQNTRRVSHSFSIEEVKALSTLLEVLQRGGDPAIILRSPGMRAAARKVAGMRSRLEAMQAAKLAKSA